MRTGELPGVRLPVHRRHALLNQFANLLDQWHGSCALRALVDQAEPSNPVAGLAAMMRSAWDLAASRDPDPLLAVTRG
jgi:hypothetical protein